MPVQNLPDTLLETAALVHVEDLSDLDGDADTAPADAPTREVVTMERTTFAWIVRFEVSGTWVADGFNIDHDRANDMLASQLGWANGSELNARVLAAPPRDAIAVMQGDKSGPDVAHEESDSPFAQAVTVTANA